MSKNQSASGLTNFVQYDSYGNIKFVSGSNTLMTVSASGAIITTGTISGSAAANATSASYASNADLLDGLDSTAFAVTAAYSDTSGSLYSTSASLSTASGSFNTRVSALEATGSALSSSILSVSSSAYATSGSLSTASGSFNSRVATIESKYATTGSNNFRAPQYVSDTTVPTGFANTTGSIYTDGGLQVTKDAYFSSSMYIKGNLTIYGTQSIAYITSSQLNIATNLITVNTATPAVRFGGLAVYDSGSTGTNMTGSLLWDSQNNSWIYDNPSGSGNYDSAMVIMGPRNASALGSEQGLTCNYLVQGHGHHHTTSSQIYHDASTTCIGTGMSITSAGAACFASSVCVAGEMAVRGNSSSYNTHYFTTGASNVAKYIQYNAVGTVINQIAADAISYINSGCNFAVGTNSPCSKMHINSTGNYIWSAGNGYGDLYIGDGTYGLSIGGAVGGGGAGDTRMWTKGGTHTFYIGTSNVDAIKVDASQKVCFASTVCTMGTQFVGLNLRVSTTTAAGNATDPAITTGGCTKVGIYFAGGCVGFGTSGNMLILTPTGRVGIGTETPDYGNLSVLFTDNTTLSSAVWGTSTAAGVTTTIYNNSQCTNSVAGLRLVTRNSGASVWNIYNVSTGASTGDLAFGNGSGGIGTEKLRITDGGNIGINNTFPCGKLQISLGTVTGGCFRTSTGSEAALTIEACGNSYLQFMNKSTSQTGLMFGNECREYSGMIWYRHDAKQLMLGAGGTETMYICGGNVGIGTTQPSWKLDVRGDGMFNGTLQLDNNELNTPKSILFSANISSGANTCLGAINWKNVQWDSNIKAQIVAETDVDITTARLVFKTGASGAAAVERMRINSSGITSFTCKPSFPGASLTCTYTCTYSSYTAGCWLGLFAGDLGFNGAYAFTVVGQFNLGGSGLYSINYSSVPYIHKSDSIGATNGNDFYGIPHTSAGHADNGAIVCFRRARYSGNTPAGNRTEFCMNVSYTNSFTATTYVLAWV